MLVLQPPGVLASADSTSISIVPEDVHALTALSYSYGGM